LTFTRSPASLCIVGKIRTNDELWARIRRLMTALRQRREEDLANEIEDALRSNTGLTDGWHLMLDGLVAAQSSGQARFTAEEQAELEEIIDAVREALRR
jgi:hypothetical protein